MTDVVRRGPVGSDAQIAFEICDLCDLIRRHATRLMAREPTERAAAIEVSELLEDVANRFLDMQEALSDRHGAPEERRPDLADRSEDREGAYEG